MSGKLNSLSVFSNSVKFDFSFPECVPVIVEFSFIVIFPTFAFFNIKSIISFNFIFNFNNPSIISLSIY